MILTDAMDLVIEAAESEVATMRMRHYDKDQIKELEEAIEMIAQLFDGYKEKA